MLAQSNIKNLLFYEPDQSVYTVVEKQPNFPGGMQSLGKYVRANLHYPPAAKAANVSGKVYVMFVVRRDGRITDIDLLKGLGFDCDEEALRVISAMPNWKPGRQSGRPVNVKYNVVVPFGVK